MATAAQIEDFREATSQLTLLAQSQLRDVLSSLSTSSDPVAVRNLLLDVFPDFMSAFGDTAAVLGADFYDMVRGLPPSAGSFETVFAQPAKTKQSEGVVRWAVGPLFEQEPDWPLFESQLLGSAQRLVMLPARETIDLMSRSDVRSGKVAAVRWSRSVNPGRAKSGKSCDFCVMLAGRGPVYLSEASAGQVGGRGSTRSGVDASGSRRAGGVGGGIVARGSQALESDYHDNCHCVPVPTVYQRESRTFSVRGFQQSGTVLVPVR